MGLIFSRWWVTKKYDMFIKFLAQGNNETAFDGVRTHTDGLQVRHSTHAPLYSFS